MSYEALIAEYPKIVIKEVILPRGLAGLYFDNEIHLDKHRSKYEKHCILAEEIGHHETTHGDITDLKSMRNWKIELVARRWGYEKIVSLSKLVECYELGYTSLDEVCTYLEITEAYLKSSIDHYSSRHGIFTEYRGYEIYFDPLYIRKP